MKYTVFGKVIDGMDTLDEFEKLPCDKTISRQTKILKNVLT